MDTSTIVLIAIVGLCAIGYVTIQLLQRRQTRRELGRSGFDPQEISSIARDLKAGNQDAVMERIAASQERKREIFKEATGIDLTDVVPTIGEEISWQDVHLQIFKVLEFDRADTTIGENEEVKAMSMFSPYGYLLVESPIFTQPVRLPIIHRDDFWLVASVFDDPNVVEFVDSDELLVTYAPRKILSDGRSGEASHVLHYLLTGEGSLEDYYSIDNDIHMAKPNPSLLFGSFIYDGEISVKTNSDPP
jgi:hypothetical protein